jgi:hypothetical protein
MTLALVPREPDAFSGCGPPAGAAGAEAGWAATGWAGAACGVLTGAVNGLNPPTICGGVLKYHSYYFL